MCIRDRFYNEAFFLIINGNGGFVGEYFYNKIFFKIANLHSELSYYFQLLLFVVLFLISINFRLKWLSSIKKIFKSKKKINSNEVANTKKEIFVENNNIQEAFSFDKKNEKNDEHKRIFNLPKLDLLEQSKEKIKKIIWEKI